MPRSSGTFSLPAGNPVVTGTLISTTWANNTLNDISNEITNSLPRDGTAPPLANIPFGNYKITGLGAATLPTDAAQYGQIQSGAANYLTAVAGTDTITANLSSPTLTAYAAGNTFRFTSAGTNTGATTLNINGLGGKTINKDGSALVAGDITSGRTYELIYDGSNFSLIGGGSIPNASITNAKLAFDGGALGNRNILINSGFRINQRSYVSGAVLAAGAYAHDRWKAGASGGNYSFTQLDTNTQITIAAGKSLIQVVEDKNVHETAYVLSWQGTAQARVGISSITPSGAYAASPILITGQVAGSGMSVEFNTGTLGKAQLEAGSIATPFENRSYGAELALTQRYFYADSKYVSVLLSGVAVTGTTHPVPMRVTPTITGTEAGFTQVSATNLGLSYYQTATSGMVLNFSAEL